MNVFGVWLAVVVLAAALVLVVSCAWSLYERHRRRSELAEAMARIAAAMQDVSVVIGRALTPVFKEVASKAIELADLFDELLPEPGESE